MAWHVARGVREHSRDFTMAAEGGGAAGSGGGGVLEDGRPEYHRVVSDMRFLNISIKTYEKKTGGGFPREEYFAYRIVSMSVYIL